MPGACCVCCTTTGYTWCTFYPTNPHTSKHDARPWYLHDIGMVGSWHYRWDMYRHYSDVIMSVSDHRRLDCSLNHSFRCERGGGGGGGGWRFKKHARAPESKSSSNFKGVPFEILHKIFYPYIERCRFYSQVKISEILVWRSHKMFLKRLPDQRK